MKTALLVMSFFLGYVAHEGQLAGEMRAAFEAKKTIRWKGYILKPSRLYEDTFYYQPGRK